MRVFPIAGLILCAVGGTEISLMSRCHGQSADAVLPVRGPLERISVNGFRSSIQHWRHIRDSSRFIQAEPDQPSYAPEQVREIVANILLFQRENGGWPKDYDMTAVLTDGQKAAITKTYHDNDTSYDNSNLHSQVDYLARAYAQQPTPEWRAACERGFDFWDCLISGFVRGQPG